ncbi:MAG: DUF1934 domain-containing protein [Oscillospiraceae bacterium]|jgi:uncharacterized beta-barrel protein YwiB (DUF1934 family)|nr:DUF1934 domain-containing protein [Oscillospiraceae bacterium]
MNNKKKVLISIKGLPIFSSNDDDAFELVTDGEYVQENGLSSFSYEESMLTGTDGQLTTFDVEQDRVVLRRGDGLSGDMIFSEKQKHHFLYDTPFGSVMLGVDTHSITKNMNDDGGNLEIRYDIEVDNVSVSQNLFKINIRSCSQ